VTTICFDRNPQVRSLATRHSGWCLSVVLSLLTLASCSSEREIPGRQEVYPVRGKVLYQGKPPVDAFVYFEPVHQDNAHPSRPMGQVQKDGTFVISTYIHGDGAPAGEYKVSLEWLTYRPFGNQWVGPDKMQGRYKDPKKSGLQATIDTKPNELPLFDLK